MAGFAFDADEAGGVASLGCLQCGSKFVGVGGDDAVVMIGGGDHGGGVFCSLLCVVIRGVSEEVFELVGIFIGEAVFGLPGPSDGEFLEADHVHDTDGREACAEEAGALGEAGTDEEAAIGSSGDGELRGGGVFFGNEVFGAGDEVIEDVLLFQFHSGLVPVLTVFATSAKVGDYVDAAHVEPGDGGGGVAGKDGDIEPTVGVEIGGVLAV